MPFTLSHAAAVLPLRSSRLVFSALVAGSFAPDLEYFIRLAPGGGWGHTIPGAFLLDVPLGLGALWMYHRLAKEPLAFLLPDSVRARLGEELTPFRFAPLGRFVSIIVSLLIGIATHLAWDGLTHPQYWLVRHWEVLNQLHRYPLIGWEPDYGILQMACSLLGLGVLALWALFWYRRTAPDPAAVANPIAGGQRAVLVLIACGVALLGSGMRAYWGIGMPTTHREYDDFAIEMVVTFGALCWWQLAMWGFFGPFRKKMRAAAGRSQGQRQPRFTVER